MKIFNMLKKKKAAVIVICIAMSLCAVIVSAAISVENPEEVTAITSEDKKDTRKAETGRKEGQIQTQEEATETSHDKEETENKSGENSSSDRQNKSNNSITSKTMDKDAPETENKTSGNEKPEQTKPAHVHEYKAVEGIETATYEVPIIGDKCSTCNENITGFAEDHIRNTSCRGYATDVVVGYETVTEEVPCIYYVCSCGATK